MNELKKLVLSMVQQKQNNVSPSSGEDLLNASIALSNETALQQNIPNPFNNTTTINYTLPQKYSQAYLVITDKKGKPLNR
jgi:hypothetical protein